MRTIAPVFSATAHHPSEPIDIHNAVEVWFDGTNYKVLEASDLYTPGGITSPGSRVVGIGTLPVTIPSSYIGSHFNAPLNYPGRKPVLGDFIRVHDTGVPNTNTRGHWRGVHTANGVFDWSFLDAVIDSFYNMGHTIMYTLEVTPSWASARPGEAGAYGTGTAAEPSNMTFWTDFCTAVATRYAGKIKYYEVWNEPNLTGFWTGTPAQLAQMTRLANQAIKAADPAAQIVGAPVTSLWTGGTGLAYFNTLCAASDGASGTWKNWVDVVANHLYHYMSVEVGNFATQMCTDFRAAVIAQGLGAKPLWNTETGLLDPDGRLMGVDRLWYAKKSMLIAAALGFSKWCYYMYDHGTNGFSDDKEIMADWDNWYRTISGKQLTVLNSLWDGRMTYTIDGVNGVFAKQ